MSNYIFTEHGSMWAAKALCGNYKPVDTVYLVCSSSGTPPSISPNVTVSYFENNLPSGYTCVKVDTGISSFIREGNPYQVVYTALVPPEDNITGKKLVTAALVSEGEILLVADISSAITCIANTNITINVPLAVPAHITMEN